MNAFVVAYWQDNICFFMETRKYVEESERPGAVLDVLLLSAELS